MQPIRFDRHAKRRMKERGVTEDEALLAIEDPDLDEPSVKGRRNAFKFISGRYLRVTYREESDYVLIITVTARKKPFKELGDENRIQ